MTATDDLAITMHLTCKICGQEWEHTVKPGRRPSSCPECQAEIRRRRNQRSRSQYNTRSAETAPLIERLGSQNTLYRLAFLHCESALEAGNAGLALELLRKVGPPSDMTEGKPEMNVPLPRLPGETG